MALLIISHSIESFGRYLKKINSRKKKLRNQNKVKRNDTNQNSNL